MARLPQMLLALSALSLAACSHVPAATIYELWNFDMAKADPAALRAAVRLPEHLRPEVGGVVLSVTTTAAGNGAAKHDFVLQEASEPAELAPLANRQRLGFALYAFRLRPDDIVRIRQLQAEQQAAKGGGGEIGIAAKACRTADLPKGAILSSTFLRVDAARGYLTVLEDIDLRKELAEVDLVKEISPCAPR